MHAVGCEGRRGVGAGGGVVMCVRTPLDPAAVQADDELLDRVLADATAALTAAIRADVDVDSELARVLAVARREADSWVLPELADTGSAVEVIRWARWCAAHPVLARVASVARRLVGGAR